MGGRQCLSPCILSTEDLDSADLDQLWVAGEGGGDVERNFATVAASVPLPARLVVAPKLE
jgi:hypothetical protein